MYQTIMKKFKTLVIIGIIMTSLMSKGLNAQLPPNIYSQFYPEAKKIVASMTLDQKIGQMSQPDIALITSNGVTHEDYVVKYNLGSLLIGGDGSPNNNGDLQTNGVDYNLATNQNWLKLATRLMSQTVDVKTPDGTVKISLLIGTDAVHGNQHVIGLPLFPHNIGLAATHNVQNFQNAGYWTAVKTLESGFNYVFAPTVAVSHNPQWGRFYETQGSDSTPISTWAESFVNAAQMSDGQKINGVMTSTKHFLGDGATLNGNDEGNARAYNFTAFYENNIKGYRGAFKAGTGNIMASYSAINGIPMSINTDLLTGKLRESEGFGGFVISDYDEMGKIAEQGLPTSFIKMTQVRAACMIINAGVDMMMLPAFRTTSITDYLSNVKECLANGDTHMDRIDDAVMRILAVKLSMGLVKLPKSEAPVLSSPEKAKLMLDARMKAVMRGEKGNVGTTTLAFDVLKAAKESLVLLKNDQNVVPVNKAALKYVVLVGDREIKENAHPNIVYSDFDNIGAQCGGWSVRWQGYEGNKFWSGSLKEMSGATSLLDGVRISLQDYSINIIYPIYRVSSDSTIISLDRTTFLNQITQLLPDMNDQNTVIIGVVTESPYAEFMGDINSKYCQTDSKEGCLYNNHINEYYSGPQKTNLNVTYNDFTWQVINKIKGHNANIPLISVLVSGRTMILDDVVSKSSGFIAAWLPGTSGGEAIAASIFGDYLFRNGDDKDQRNTLPVDWMADSASLTDFPIYEASGALPEFKNKQWSRGFGISTKKQTVQNNKLEFE